MVLGLEEAMVGAAGKEGAGGKVRYYRSCVSFKDMFLPDKSSMHGQIAVCTFLAPPTVLLYAFRWQSMLVCGRRNRAIICIVVVLLVGGSNIFYFTSSPLARQEQSNTTSRDEHHPQPPPPPPPPNLLAAARLLEGFACGTFWRGWAWSPPVMDSMLLAAATIDGSFVALQPGVPLTPDTITRTFMLPLHTFCKDVLFVNIYFPTGVVIFPGRTKRF